jgi:hypothetical protein
LSFRQIARTFGAKEKNMKSVLILIVLAMFISAPAGAQSQEFAVSGTGVHHFTTAVIHSTEPTPTGMIQRSTETVDLAGDLTGRLLYHPTSVFDFVAGTLTNTGHQIFSGTVLGSKPVLLSDDEFRFRVDLASGATTGQVHLHGRLAGPKIRCDLNVTGTGLDAAGDATFVYTGQCRIREEKAK